jgi:hypothetical protein
MDDDRPEVELWIRRAIGGDRSAVAWVKDHASGDGDPVLLVLTGVLEGRREPLSRALSAATTTRDRQIVAIADAFLRDDRDLVDALAREHLVDHPDSVVVAWIAAGAGHAAQG